MAFNLIESAEARWRPDYPSWNPRLQLNVYGIISDRQAR